MWLCFLAAVISGESAPSKRLIRRLVLPGFVVEGVAYDTAATRYVQLVVPLRRGALPAGRSHGKISSRSSGPFSARPRLGGIIYHP
jgi:hypothetical protein